MLPALLTLFHEPPDSDFEIQHIIEDPSGIPVWWRLEEEGADMVDE
ncbi:MAG: hypothetical protein H0W02_01810 [Ktedonobacteraceae bacterium]|nr:hypothetical protein [Ktedonobacteraceae bacterium]